MNVIPQIRIADYDYPLEQSRIAQYPLPNRDMSKLLVYQNGKISHCPFSHLPSLLNSKDLLIVNNSKVVKARMIFKKATGASIEVLIIEPITPSDYALAFASHGSCVWKCIVGNLKRWKGGELTMSIESLNLQLKAIKKEELSDGIAVEFSWDNSSISFAEVIDKSGHVPIPPYLNRASDESDSHNYQTVYSLPEGSVAAPTAGFHFTRELLNQITNNGIGIEQITLHVGAGTFKPVKAETISEHEMHTEHFYVSRELLQRIKGYQGNIIAVGTTTLRTLESLYWLGVKLYLGYLPEGAMPSLGQWEAYGLPDAIPLGQSLEMLEQWLTEHSTSTIEAITQLCIVPGYRFKTVDTLITNYHQPRSTLLLLVAAFIGNDWKKVYDYAMRHDFRFLSYGDSSILFREGLDKRY
ncbi:MAG: S-adenosylmethionine:tRNA ribosyltransferase-isomerase [Tenuifilaceae bacterium]|nr:S-adenosylmethionine:tRNA ribosyltransferase-isomerase [Bacteroidales bacterium]MDI9515774.1 S-adenosylmethionine:tRNA ribosyltransferase-isomerase [Bacteroidota bacterium]OQC62176.1 MAG: S-adenosylmethionine:tRNA ribosyltransferase-isomerase [Bacteroidetes bacterium ADurb.Bin008]HNV81054.1 S-adenosylmethionine:tRNA ribosyltransferase-isomerase [Tenuifilaceae bacterium]HOF92163.1 S-adenosylmethionine:tRNA ribosyltransferase-isomerase [Tenuifilaceae bacterium]